MAAVADRDVPSGEHVNRVAARPNFEGTAMSTAMSALLVHTYMSDNDNDVPDVPATESARRPAAVSLCVSLSVSE